MEGARLEAPQVVGEPWAVKNAEAVPADIRRAAAKIIEEKGGLTADDIYTLWTSAGYYCPPVKVLEERFAEARRLGLAAPATGPRS
jgi:hypothetical protein